MTDAVVTPGATLPLHLTMAVSGTATVHFIGAEANAGGKTITDDAGVDLTPGRPGVRQLSVKVPDDRPITQPYWLSQPASTGLYAVTDPNLIGRPENLPAVFVMALFKIGGQTVAVLPEPRGPDGRRVEVVAPVSLRFPFGVRLFKPGTPREVTVEATARRPNAAGIVRLTAPAGWRVDPAERPFATDAADPKRTVTFTVTPPANVATADLSASVEVAGRTYDVGWDEIRYPHLPPLLLQPRATLRCVSVNLATAGHAIGYLPGAGDSVAECLTEMGYAVTTLSTDDLDAAKLKRFDAVVIGVRAFNVRPDLGTKAQAFFDYAAAGGTVVEQYNRPDGLHGPIAPYPLKLSGSRVTDETATMTFLDPASPVLNVPNRITAADFDGWVQERGIYYPTQWDDRWKPILGGSDPGEPRLDGGLLVADVGRGHWVYTGLVFFRQLPAGVPGAYRLFANLVSLGHT